jgi:hypothetical protein
MRLLQYQVKNFRSVETSGWLTVDDVTALIGVNESGKTNLLLPLWKLNPAREGAIEPTSDFPKPRFGEIRAAPKDFWFIEAEFVMGKVAEKVAGLADLPLTAASLVRVKRFYDGSYTLSFPEHDIITTVEARKLGAILGKHRALINECMPLRDEGDAYNAVLKHIDAAVAQLAQGAPQGAEAVRDIRVSILNALADDPDDKSKLVPLARDLGAALQQIEDDLNATAPHDRSGVRPAIIAALPKFVYYSNYGNLDSEIYLPHVVENLRREDLGTKEAAKARTLRVLFGFVRLSAQEILDLGSDTVRIDDTGPGMITKKRRAPKAKRSAWWRSVQVTRAPADKDLDKIAEAKRTRSILLQSAGTDLTRQFKDWWQQGDYRFRFEADGNFFRIWVADARRPAEVELENRSTGLQWFLSFYLVFLVESRGEHRDAVLLLDEPGVSLHPLAQRDLSAFFEQLGKTNQILYTTHSPFLVEADRLDRARKVFVSADGSTKVSAKLGGTEGTDTQRGAAYAVQSALNLSVAEGLLPGSKPILVAGRADQHYLTTIKTLLISAKRIAPARDLIFAPAGGPRTAHIIANILTGREDELPLVLLDGDARGQQMAALLREDLYVDHPDRVLDLGDLVGIEGAGIEDLFPVTYLAEEMDRIERTAEVRLLDVVQKDKPFVAQVDAWIASEGLKLDAAWKVQLALRATARALAIGPDRFDEAVLARWVKMFEAFGE